MKTVKRLVIARTLGGEEGNDDAWEFLGNEVVLYDTVMMDNFDYVFIKTPGMNNTNNQS